jgi:hypothetical protein
MSKEQWIQKTKQYKIYTVPLIELFLKSELHFLKTLPITKY